MRHIDFHSVAFGNERSYQISPATSQSAIAIPDNPKISNTMTETLPQESRK